MIPIQDKGERPDYDLNSGRIEKFPTVATVKDKAESRQLFEWVKASEELSEESGMYFTKCVLSELNGDYQEDFPQISHYNSETTIWHVDSKLITVTHWLKPIQSSLKEETKIVVWKDGTYKVTEGQTWEYENDKNWLVTIPASFKNKLATDTPEDAAIDAYPIYPVHNWALNEMTWETLVDHLRNAFKTGWTAKESSLKEERWEEIFSDFEKYVAYKNEDDYLLFKEWVTQTAYKPIEYKEANHEFTEEVLLKILSKHSKNFKKWEKSEKPLYYLQVNGHEAINAMKESSLTPKSIRDSDLVELRQQIENGTERNSDLIEENISLKKEVGELEERIMTYELEKAASLKPNKLSDEEIEKMAEDYSEENGERITKVHEYFTQDALKSGFIAGAQAIINKQK